MSLKSNSIKLLTKIIRPGIVASCLSGFFRALLRLVPIRKGVARRNLAIILPDTPPMEREKILWRTYDHLIWVGVEFTILQSDPQQALAWVKAENAETLDDSVGGILLGCHAGNWELTAAWLAQSGHKVSAIVRESEDQGERGIIADMRANCGVSCLPKTGPMTKAIGVLKRNEFLGIMPDQHGGPEGITAPFFGLDTKTSQGPAVFAYLTKKPIIPIYSNRISPFKHKIRFGTPLVWEDKGNRDETILGITSVINAEMERIILEAPDQWLAQHRRFREYY